MGVEDQLTIERVISGVRLCFLSLSPVACGALRASNSRDNGANASHCMLVSTMLEPYHANYYFYKLAKFTLFYMETFFTVHDFTSCAYLMCTELKHCYQ